MRGQGNNSSGSALTGVNVELPTEIQLDAEAIQITAHVQSLEKRSLSKEELFAEPNEDDDFDPADLDNIHVDAGFERLRLQMEKSESSSSHASNHSSKYHVKSGKELNIKRVDSLNLDQQEQTYDGKEIKQYYNEYDKQEQDTEEKRKNKKKDKKSP